jgi:hypothetical protein
MGLKEKITELLETWKENRGSRNPVHMLKHLNEQRDGDLTKELEERWAREDNSIKEGYRPPLSDEEIDQRYTMRMAIAELNGNHFDRKTGKIIEVENAPAEKKDDYIFRA